MKFLRWNVEIAKKNHNGWKSLALILYAVSALEKIR